MPWLPTRMASTVLHTRSYDAASMLSQTSAENAAATSTAALPVSVRRKLRSGVSMLRAHAVVPERVDSTATAGPPSRRDAIGRIVDDVRHCARVRDQRDVRRLDLDDMSVGPVRHEALRRGR